MNRKKLSNEIIDFGLKYGIFNISCGTKEIKQRTYEQFGDVVFVEGLINMIIVKAKNLKDVDRDKLIELLSELERLRLELEWKAPEKTEVKC